MNNKFFNTLTELLKGVLALFSLILRSFISSIQQSQRRSTKLAAKFDTYITVCLMFKNFFKPHHVWSYVYFLQTVVNPIVFDRLVTMSVWSKTSNHDSVFIRN